MRVYIILILIYGLLFGCGVWQNRSKLTSESSDLHAVKASLSTLTHKDSASNTQVLTFFKDSADQNYWVQLWPRGKFTFSNDKGFVGEAEKVIMQGNVRGVKTGAGLTISQNKSSEATRTDLKIVEQLKLKDKDVLKKSSPSAIWLIGLAVVIGVVLIYNKGSG